MLMGRTKKALFTIVDTSDAAGGRKCIECKGEEELTAELSKRDLAHCLVFAGAPLSVERNVTFSLNAPKRRGRPAGTGKKRGRPPGSGKKPGRPKKDAAPAAATTPAAAPKKRGRPPKAKAAVANLLAEASGATHFIVDEASFKPVGE
jgi:hypothetical protein